MSNSEAALKPPTFVPPYHEHVTASTFPVCADQPMVLWPSVPPPPHAPVLAVVDTPPMNLKLAPVEFHV